MDNDGQIHGSIGDNVYGEHTVDQLDLVKRYQKYIKRSEHHKRAFNAWAKAGKRAYRGYERLEDHDRVASSQVSSGKIFKNDINYLRQPIERQIAQTYARNPKFVAKPLAPVWVDADPIMDQMTGQMIPQVDMFGMPIQNDISEQVCDVIEALMEVVFKEANFKAEAKACTREAHHSPASIMQIGYQFNEKDQRDEIYFRRRRFEDFIIDPDAEIYDGVVRRCKYMGVKWTLTKDEALSIGLDWDALKSEENTQRSGDDDPKGTVYQIWDRSAGVVVWVPKHGSMLAMEPQEWPWQIDGFPFEILKLIEDSDQQFSRPLVVEAMGIQEELSAQREEITAHTTCSRPFTAYDPQIIDEDQIAEISTRGKRANIPIKGLLGMPEVPLRRIGDESLSPEYYNHYERNRQELTEILGTSQNQALRTTNTTASEAQIVDQNAGNATSAKIDILSDFMNNCVKKAVQIMKQTYTLERVTQVTGRDNSKFWVKWIGSDILHNVTIDVESGSTEREDSLHNRQIALNMLEVMKGVPGIDVVKLGIDVLREHGKRNAETYRIDMQPPMPNVHGMTGAGHGPHPAEVSPPMAHPAGAGPTTGMNPGQSIADQMNPMI